MGIADTSGGLETTFDKISELSHHCKFKDCTHNGEKGCAVLEAMETGELDQGIYENFMKLEREKSHFETTVAEKRKKEKLLGKIVKDYHKKDVKKRGH